MIEQIIVLDDVIPTLYQDAIEELLLGEASLPWFLINDITYVGNSNPLGTATPAFVHLFKDEFSHQTEKYEFLTPIAYSACDKINFKLTDILRVRAFLQTPTHQKSTTNNPHVDLHYPHVAGVYYVNNCAGPTTIYKQSLLTTSPGEVASTAFEVLQTVAPKKGRMVLFNGAHYHASSSPEDTKRCIINFDLI